MHPNESIIRDLYSASEGRGTDTEKFIAMFSDDGYMWDMASGQKFYRQDIGKSITGFASAFPDAHRELLSVYCVENVVVVELTTRGTHRGELPLGHKTLAPTGKAIDVPSCDVFHLDEQGKITSFHCYNEASILMQQLGVGAG